MNLGEDTDTTRAFTGGLAGLLYGFDTIPKSWLQQIARKDDIIEIGDRLRDFATANILALCYDCNQSKIQFRNTFS